MPMIRIEMFEGRSAEQKRACAEAVTKAWAETCNGKPEYRFTSSLSMSPKKIGRLAGG